MLWIPRSMSRAIHLSSGSMVLSQLWLMRTSSAWAMPQAIHLAWTMPRFSRSAEKLKKWPERSEPLGPWTSCTTPRYGNLYKFFSPWIWWRSGGSFLNKLDLVVAPRRAFDHSGWALAVWFFMRPLMANDQKIHGVTSSGWWLVALCIVAQFTVFAKSLLRSVWTLSSTQVKTQRHGRAWQVLYHKDLLSMLFLKNPKKKMIFLNFLMSPINCQDFPSLPIDTPSSMRPRRWPLLSLHNLLNLWMHMILLLLRTLMRTMKPSATLALAVVFQPWKQDLVHPRPNFWTPLMAKLLNLRQSVHVRMMMMLYFSPTWSKLTSSTSLSLTWS